MLKQIYSFESEELLAIAMRERPEIKMLSDQKEILQKQVALPKPVIYRRSLWHILSIYRAKK
jgi:hypothetical protein